MEALLTGDDFIHALSTHSIVVPCAFPIGLPRSIRESLLQQYRGELRTRLLRLVQRNRWAQSDALLVRDDCQIVTDSKRWLLRMYKSGWEALDLEQRKERWEGARRGLPHELLEGWWASMEENMKVGLAPPGGRQ